MNRVLIGSRTPAVPTESLMDNVHVDAIRASLAGVFDADRIDQLLNPHDHLSEFIYGLSKTPEGMMMIEWMMDLSLRAPYRVMGKTIEETALNAAKREGLNLFGETILAAIAKGEQSLKARKSGATQ